RGRALTSGELHALFAACARDRSDAGIRDAAMLAVLYGAGLRRAELVAIDAHDWDAESGAITVRAGKGNKGRLVYATNGGRSALSAWLRLRGAEAGALFWPADRLGRVHAGRLSTQAVLRMVQKRAQQAGVR